MAKQKKGGLGKGLDALLSSAPMETAAPAPAPAPQKDRPQKIDDTQQTSGTQATKSSQATQATQPSQSSQAADQAKSAASSKPAAQAGSNNAQQADQNAQAGKPVKTGDAAQKPVQKELPVKHIRSAQSTQIDSEGPYEINEDKTTIKGVISREARPQAAQKQTPEKSMPQQRSQRQEAQRRNAQGAQGAALRQNVQEEPVQKDTDEIDISLIKPNPEQPRINFKKEELEELAESIKKNGLLQPVVVRKSGENYQIIAGERRYQACKLVGLQKIPVRIMDANDDEAIILALVENVQRSDLNPIEEAYGYRRMMERGKMTQTQVAQAVSKGRSTIANALRLLELPEDAQELLFEDKITAGHARAILSVPSKEDRLKLTKKLQEEQLSVRETEALARLMAGKKEKKKVARPSTPKSYKTVARSLSEALDTEVRVRSTKDKNKIEIEFKDEADLERLYRMLTSE